MPSVQERTTEKAYAQGLYDGGDRIAEQHLPPFHILGDISIEQIVTAGVQTFYPHMHKVAEPAQIAEELRAAMDEHRPYAIVRLGDGELLTMAQDVLMPAHDVLKAGPFLAYAGVAIPDSSARELLVQAVSQADRVGIPQSRHPHFQKLMFPVFRAHHLDFRSMPLTLSTINYQLYEMGLLLPLLTGRRVLLVGDAAPDLAVKLVEHHGIAVTGTVSPVNGMRDMDRVMGEIAGFQYDIALVSAGVPAVVIVSRIARELGKVALDFGHMADYIAYGKQPDRGEGTL
ncbi:hypothetical protein SY83_07210 [Paenibacillus swuensis]|uniref:GT-D fold-like domain-containing protein n=1 Tax=Paenibacillus swuensis TaxID=1178515 RepID=A0A172TNW2_9BACL|nr:hypothetical protein SY83_07210 [Paenibacillus swuensis]